MLSRFVAPERTLYPYVLRVLTILTFVLNILIVVYYIQFSEQKKCPRGGLRAVSCSLILPRGYFKLSYHTIPKFYRELQLSVLRPTLSLPYGYRIEPTPLGISQWADFAQRGRISTELLSS